MLKFLRKELVALAAETGAALTVLSQLASEVVMPSGFRALLMLWREALTAVWSPLLKVFDIALQPQLIAALSLSLFLILMGIGARMARARSRTPLAPLEWRFLDDMSFLSLLVYAGLVYAFLIGSGPDPAKEPPISLFGSEVAGRYTFALIVTVGYALADFIGHKAFHRRLLRVAVVVGAILASLILATPGTAA